LQDFGDQCVSLLNGLTRFVDKRRLNVGPAHPKIVGQTSGEQCSGSVDHLRRRRVAPIVTRGDRFVSRSPALFSHACIGWDALRIGVHR
jgi:hypothetical protein